MWFDCRDAMGGVAWPDGRALLDQPVKLVRAFRMIASENHFWEKATDR